MDLWGTHLNCVHRERGLLKAENQLNSTGLAFELYSSTSQLTIDHRPHQTHQEYQRHQKHQRPDSNGQAFGVTLNAFKPCSSQVNRIRQRRTGVPERTILVKRATSLWRAILVKRAILVERVTVCEIGGHLSKREEIECSDWVYAIISDLLGPFGPTKCERLSAFEQQRQQLESVESFY